MKSKYYFPHTATVFFLLTVAVALFSWIGSIYGLGRFKGWGKVGIEACYGEFCPDTGIGHSPGITVHSKWGTLGVRPIS